MNSLPLFSVVIPCYNQGAYLRETIQSVVTSIYPHIEVIIVDDGSKDNSREVANDLAKKFTDRNIQYIHQNNSGPSKARNHGIRLAKGRYILPLDADDLIANNYISEAVTILESRPEVQLVYCEAEKFEGKTGHWKLRPFSLDLLARDNMIFVSGIFRKVDWEKCGGFDENMVWGREDWEFWISLLKNGGEVVKLPFVGFYYRVKANSRRKSMTSERKKKIIAYINHKHKGFIHARLNGPLRFQRTHSKKYNSFLKFLGILKDS